MAARVQLWLVEAKWKVARIRPAMRILNELKSGRQPIHGVDLLRAHSFLADGQTMAGLEAVKEELRHFPDNKEAVRLATKLRASLPPEEVLGPPEFQELYRAIAPYTMVGQRRLLSLYHLALYACVRDLPGDFVECGAAGGGSSALLATVTSRHSRRPRKLYSCDTFSGMPAPSAADTHAGQSAQDTGWGAGTCAAPIDSLRKICGILGVLDTVETVPGLFADTLPVLQTRLDAIALLHMDGDWYSSTRDILVHLFDRVTAEAPIQIDDYGYWEGCKRAVDEFAAERGLSLQLNRIDETGVWLLRPASQMGRSERSVMANVGCGGRVHDGWINLDLEAVRPGVIPYDLAHSLPLATASCDVVYHAAVLEHIRREEVSHFIGECFRVLKPGGLLRVGVPNLEELARLYLEKLEGALAGDAAAETDYDWMLLEIFDQAVREREGGAMLDYLARKNLPNREFIHQRFGVEGEEIFAAIQAQGLEPRDAAPPTIPAERAVAIGRFRLSGEVHHWMYDQFSLGRLLREEGFAEIQRATATDSRIPHWAKYHLDVTADGRVIKPDLFFMEGKKPGVSSAIL